MNRSPNLVEERLRILGDRIAVLNPVQVDVALVIGCQAHPTIPVNKSNSISGILSGEYDVTPIGQELYPPKLRDHAGVFAKIVDAKSHKIGVVIGTIGIGRYQDWRKLRMVARSQKGDRVRIIPKVH